MKDLEKIIWEKGQVYDYSFNRNYLPNDLDILKMHLSGNNSFLFHLQSWLDEYKIKEIEKINIRIREEHFSFDGVPILLLEIWINERVLPLTYIYD